MEHPASPRVVALVGPQGAGKTALLEALLEATGAPGLKAGGLGEGLGAERAMTVELGVAGTRYLGEQWTFLDTPGATEFSQEARAALMVADAALVVSDVDVARAGALAPLFAFLDAQRIPHLLFLNTRSEGAFSVRELLEALQSVSARPLVLREVPLRRGGNLTGVVDVVSERAWDAGEEGQARLVPLPESERPHEEAARRELLERLADTDDRLLEQLLEDVVPPPARLYGYLTHALQEDWLVPVFLGDAERGLGVERLLKGLRHEVPPVEQTCARRGLEAAGEGPLAQVFKTHYLPHTGKLSFVRLWRGTLAENGQLAGGRIGGLARVHGTQQQPVGRAEAGEVVAVGRLEAARTGELVDTQGSRPMEGWPGAPPPVHQVVLQAEKRSDDVKLPAVLARMVDEDGSLSVDQDPDTQVLLLGGQGELHLRAALERLRTRHRMPVATRPPPVPYRETVRREGSQHSRYKRQSGGHGQFGDVVVEVQPLSRGQGFHFESAIVGGVVPRQYIPAVEEGVKDGLRRGPLGFPVVDVAVTLTGGTYHSVDSSDQAFRTAGRLAISEVLPKLESVLLEPVLHVDIHVPREATPRAQRLVTSRRGQLLGYDAHPSLPNWDVVSAYVPQAEMQGFIIELKSATAGLGSFQARMDHYAELVGKQAEKVVSHQAEASAR